MDGELPFPGEASHDGEESYFVDATRPLSLEQTLSPDSAVTLMWLTVEETSVMGSSDAISWPYVAM